MGGVTKALAGVAVADPVARRSVDGRLVEGDRAPGPVLGARHPLMFNRQRDEGGDRDEQCGEWQRLP